MCLDSHSLLPKQCVDSHSLLLLFAYFSLSSAALQAQVQILGSDSSLSLNQQLLVEYLRQAQLPGSLLSADTLGSTGGNSSSINTSPSEPVTVAMSTTVLVFVIVGIVGVVLAGGCYFWNWSSPVEKQPVIPTAIPHYPKQYQDYGQYAPPEEEHVVFAIPRTYR